MSCHVYHNTAFSLCLLVTLQHYPLTCHLHHCTINPALWLGPCCCHELYPSQCGSSISSLCRPFSENQLSGFFVGFFVMFVLTFILVYILISLQAGATTFLCIYRLSVCRFKTGTELTLNHWVFRAQYFHQSMMSHNYRVTFQQHLPPSPASAPWHQHTHLLTVHITHLLAPAYTSYAYTAGTTAAHTPPMHATTCLSQPSILL
jgi:glycerol uptake facilitator-like aquaporin